MKSFRRAIEFGLVMLALLAATLGSALAFATPAAAQNSDDRVVVGQDLVINQNETVAGNVSVTNGDLTVYGTVDGKISVVDGNADIYGKVLGDVAVLTGGGVTLYNGSSVGGNVLASEDIDLMDKSFVGGSATSLGGHVNKENGATVNGSIGEMTNPFQAIPNLVLPDLPSDATPDQSLSNAPFSRLAELLGVGLLSLLILLLSAGATAVVPSRVRTASATLQAEPGPSIVVGIIAAFLIFPAAGLVAALLTISIVGAILLPVLALALIAAFLLGFVVSSHWLGKHLHETTRQGGAPMSLPIQAPVLIIEVLLGAAVILASTLIPLIFLPNWMVPLMFLLLYSIACVGMGATILSRIGTLAPPKRAHPHRVLYPTQAHNHYGSSMQHTPPQMVAAGSRVAEHSNTRPLGPDPSLPREE